MSGTAADLPPAVRDELERLAGEWALPSAAAGQLAALLALLAADEHAPTTVRAPARAIHVHIADALAGLAIPELRTAARLADLGAGAGIPGLPLAAALPTAHVDLVESNGRKCAFIAAAATAAGIGNVAVVADRAETWVDGRGRIDVVTARALAPLAVIAEYAAPLLREGGVLVAWKGRRDPAEEEAAATAAQELGLAVDRVVAAPSRTGADHRHFHVLRKISPTPTRFPRRPGMAAKRPLGARIESRSDRARR